MEFNPPGSWNPESRDVAMMVCTAGHVDHGKTSLVRWLTGCETDRLKQEKERGLTIEPGFAPCSVSQGVSVGITDVPGHEKFIKNMVAGVSGVGMCILVIAADDGIMPQTAEHLQIMELLGVDRGVVALTKMDLVDKDLMQQRIGAIRDWLSDTFLQDAPICPVSSQNGEGILEFHRQFSETVNRLVHRRQMGIFRMPVERVFSMQGFGRVLSGVPVAGQVVEGDLVELVPGGARGRIRGMQCFGRTTEEGRSDLCLALNIPELARENPQRGQVLCVPGRLRAAMIFHSRISMLEKTGLRVKNGEHVKLHFGTAEVQARLYCLEGPELQPGDSCWVTLVTDELVPMALCDRYIVRKLSPVRTLGGGRISDIVYHGRRPRKAATLRRLQQLEQHYREAGYRDRAAAALLVEQCLEMNHVHGASCDELLKDVLLRESTLRELLDELEKRECIVRIGAVFIHVRNMGRLCGELEEDIEQLLSQGETMIEKRLVAQAIPPAVKDVLFQELVARGTIDVKGDRVLSKQSLTEPPPEQVLAERIYALYAETAFKSPRPEEVSERLGESWQQVKPVLDMLLSEGRLVRTSAKVVVTREHMMDAQRKVVDAILKKGALDSGDFKFMIDSTRKYALSILEYMDRAHITLRIDSLRKLAPNYEKRMLK